MVLAYGTTLASHTPLALHFDVLGPSPPISVFHPPDIAVQVLPALLLELRQLAQASRAGRQVQRHPGMVLMVDVVLVVEALARDAQQHIDDICWLRHCLSAEAAGELDVLWREESKRSLQ